MRGKEAALERLAAADASHAQIARVNTLDPARERAHTLREIGEQQLSEDEDATIALAFADALVAVVASQREHFPDNIFEDHDHLAGVLLRAARGPGGTDRVARLRDRIVDLHAAFGRHSTIRFRYGHDFAYGFDWQRWVARDPTERGGIGPFDVSFLARMRERGREIATAIERGHPKFPKVDAGDWRNPFPFSRAPEHETRLLRDLAAHDAIPVRAWRAEASYAKDADATTLRTERARALQIPAAGS